MDKDLIKGLLIFLAFIVAIATLFIMVSESGPDKAKCISDALGSKVPLANIDKLCKLTETRPTH